VSLRLVHVSYATAAGFNRMWHRTHEKPPPGHKYSLGVANDLDVLVGVTIVGRPVAREFDDGLTLQVSRAATDGTKNANSMLYGAAARAAQALGFGRVITYTQDGESGVSLRAAGYRPVAERKPRPGWDMPGRHREGHGSDDVGRILWERVVSACARAWEAPSRPDDAGRSGAMPPALWEEP
jgi:hypothetical protein